MKNFCEGARIVWTMDPTATRSMMPHGEIKFSATADPHGKNSVKGYMVQLDREPNPRYINEEALVSESDYRRKMWEASVESALREVKSLQVFCEEHIGYSQYEEVLEDLIRALEMEAVTAANM